MRWGVVVLAGGLERDPLAHAMGTPRKALARLGETTSLARTLTAVRDAGLERCVTVSGPDARDAVVHGEFVEEGKTSIENAQLGLAGLPRGVNSILFLPADTPLMTGAMLRHFTETVERRLPRPPTRWYAAGLCPASEFAVTYPSAAFQSLMLREGPYLSGALFACSPEGFRHGLKLFAAMRESRKNQLAMVWKLGPLNFVRYLMRRVSLADAERIIGRALAGEAVVVSDVDPATCLDFDNEPEFAVVRAIVERYDRRGIL